MKIFLLFTTLFLCSNLTFAQAPVLNCPSDINTNNDAGVCGAIVTYTIPTCSSNCTGVTITQTDATGLTSGDTFPVGTTTIEYTATGPGGSTVCTFNITVSDNEPPTITHCPADVTTVNDPGICGAVITYTTPTATDNCGAPVIVSKFDGSGLFSGDVFPIGTTTIVYKLEDDAGNVTTCSFDVTVSDTEDPTFGTACLSDMTVSTDPGSCDAVVNYTTPAATDNCSVITLNQTDGTGLATGSTFPIGTTTQSFEALDAAGNSVTCSFTVTVEDNEAPAFTICTSDITVNNDAGTCDAVVTYTLPVGADNCSGEIVTQIDATGLTSGDNFPIGTTIQQYKITDAVGNEGDTCTFYITVEDVEAASISCPSNQTIYADASCNATLADYTGMATVTDHCDISIVTVTQSPTAGSTLSTAGTHSITLTATDTSGNVATCTFDVDVLDTITPTITCPTDQNVSASGTCQASLGNYTGLATVADNCDASPAVTQNPVAGTTITSSQVVWLIVTDASGNADSCSFQVIVDDPIAPTVTCISDSTVYLDASCDYTLPDFVPLITSTDNCDPNPSITQSPVPGTVLSGGGNQFISFTATDISGNSSVCSFLLTMADTLAPTLTCVPDQDEYVNSNCEFTLADYTSLASATDNCGGITFITQSPAAGTVVTGTVSVVTITAQDGLGNSTNCTFNVNLIDTIKPVINICVNDTTIGADANCEYIMADFSSLLGATDNCNNITITQSVAIGTSLSTGSTTTVQMYATDDAGNVDSCAFDITVIDNTAPVIDCPLNPDVPANANCEYVIPDYYSTLTIVDNCDPTYTFSQSVPAGTVLSGIGASQTIAIFVSDLSGNNNSCSFTITVADTTAPDLTCPSDTVLDIDASCQYTLPDLTTAALVTDFCDPSPAVFQSPGMGVILSGINTITLTAQDASGNTSTCTFNAIANDSIPPQIVCPADIESCDSLISYLEPIGTDNCGIPVTTQTDGTGLSSGSFFPVGVTTLTYSVTDDLNNTTTCSFDVEIFPPVVVDAGPGTLIEEGESYMLDGTVSNASSFEWSPNYNMTDGSTLTPTVSPTVSTEYFLTATSPDGCEAEDGVIVNVNTLTMDDLVINNFLSPNGDGKNDTWNVNKLSLISGCRVSIFNRWGTLVWETNAYSNNWGGTDMDGNLLPEGTYYYVISCGNEDFKGSVLLMK